MIGALPASPTRWAAPAALLVHHVEQATVVPWAAEPDAKAAMPFRIGVFGADGTPVEAAIHWRGRRAANPPPFAEPCETWDGDFVYGGQLWDHFGHFLLEGLARAWAFAQMPGPILWQRRTPQSQLLDWQQDILDRLGLGARDHRVVDRPVRVARLAIPEPGLVARRYLHPWQASLLAVHPYRAPVPGRRIWLSRTGLHASLSRIEGEAAVEAALAAEGWTILHPEALSISAQLAAFEAADIIAGFQGSAFHGLLLGRDVRARIVIFNRGERSNPNYGLIAAAKGLDQDEVALDLEHVAGKGTRSSFRLTRPEQLLDVLRAVSAAVEAAPRS